MNKILALKEWVTLEEAAVNISSLVSDSVKVADIYQFALEGHLTLSVNFINPVPFKLGYYIEKNEVEFEKKQRGLEMSSMAAPNLVDTLLYDGTWVRMTNRLVGHTKGVSELLMVGNGRRYIESLYQATNSKVKVKINKDDSILVKRGDMVHEVQSPIVKDKYSVYSGEIYLSTGFVKAQTLDEDDCSLVILTKELNRFIQSLTGQPILEKPLHTSERYSLLVIIAALLNHSKINFRQNGTTPKLKKMTDDIHAPLDEGTIREKLKQIDDALEAKVLVKT